MSDESLGVRSISHAGLVVEDINVVGNFFEHMLGLRRMYHHHSDDGKQLLGLAVDDLLIELIQYPEGHLMHYRASGTARMHLGFTVADLDRAHRRAQELGVEVVSAVQEARPAKYCFLSGPEDIIFELVEYEGGIARSSQLFKPPEAAD